MKVSAWPSWLVALVPLAACGHEEPPLLPDLMLDRDTLATDLSVESKNFIETACELSAVDACVEAPGERKLLRFSVSSANGGTADLVLGDPRARPGEYQFSDCHGHYHLADYAAYELVADGGATVAAGHKQAFCLMDSTRSAGGPDVAMEPKYTCTNQGLQMGWADLYDASVPCQWIDITGVPDGDYELVVRVNPDGLLDELDLDNNEQRLPVRIGSPELESPTEPCDAALNPDALAGVTRECGWTRAAEWECVPGSYFAAGCAPADERDESSCSGQPVLRVCDAAAANCTVGSSLGSAPSPEDPACPQIDILKCPPSGRVTAFTGSHEVGDEYRCDVDFRFL